MKYNDMEKKFASIQRELNYEFIGQVEFIENLCGYFKNKIYNDEKGIIVLVGKRDTFKKESTRLLFERLEEVSVISNGKIDEVDLESYDFNLGYNAFLTDLYEKLTSDSEAIVFRNTEKASNDILRLLSNMKPNEVLKLENKYAIRNKFLVESEEDDDEIISEINCPNKFFVFLYDCEKGTNFDKFEEEYLQYKDIALYSKNLTIEEKNILIKNEILRKIEKIQGDINIEITVDGKSGEDDYGLYSFLQSDYEEDGSFDIKEYISYTFYKPLLKLINEQQLEDHGEIVVYVKENKIYCKANNELYKLHDYLVPTLEEAKYKLDSIVGIKDLKNFVINVHNNYKVQKIRERLGMPTSHISLNMIFAGNAGTGKTNAARITFDYLNALGILKKGIFKEVSKADFVTENPSETAKRTNDIINSALGGMLFIDEAYSLCESENDKIGKEIVDALLKGIEDNREDLVVILAGYEKDMEEFLGYNQGLKSRFPNWIHFKDYNPTEMYKIAVDIAKSKGYRIAKNVKPGLIDLFTRNQLTGKNDLGNARFVRNIVENAILDASKKYLSNKSSQIDLLDNDNFNFRVNAKFDLEKKLNEIIGAEDVKKLLRSQYKLIMAQEKRKSVGVNTKIDQNLNMVFAGNPGTGKTTIARIVAEMLNSMGLLKVGQLIETDRSGFVSEVPGETAKKTEAKFMEAIGGILFIDEAYTLTNDSLGREAIETLLKLIEDYSSDVIVILAGYEEEMEDFFDVNIGLKSRFPLWTNFEDYNPNQLLEMSVKLIESRGFILSRKALEVLQKSFVNIYENSDAQSGNGRLVRNYVEKLIIHQSIRIAEEDTSMYEMNLITNKDVEAITLEEYDTEFNLEDRLDGIVEHEKAKEFLRNQYKFIKIKEKRKRLGIKGDLNKYMNIVFTGEVGTGKKSILNVLSEMYYSMGIVKSKYIAELDNQTLVTSLLKGEKIEEILNAYIGKILFIENFHEIYKTDNYNEIISELVKFINKNSNKIIVVISGNKEEMKNIVLSNEGLNYRFPIWVDFDNYSEIQLYNLALDKLESQGYKIGDTAKEILGEVVTEMSSNNNLKLRNGLMIKQYLENLIRAQSIRVCDESGTVNNINVIISEDILNAKNEFFNKNLL